MLKKILLPVVVVASIAVLAMVVLIAMQPSEYEFERTTTIDAPPSDVFEHIDDLRRWDDWSPWADDDPDWQASYEGPERGEGAIFEWEGDDDTGSGRMIIVESRPDEYVELKLEFFEPFESQNTTAFTLDEGEDESTTKVTWKMAGEHTFIGKAVSLFVDIEDLVGQDYDSGLENLADTVTEKRSTK